MDGLLSTGPTPSSSLGWRHILDISKTYVGHIWDIQGDPFFLPPPNCARIQKKTESLTGHPWKWLSLGLTTTKKWQSPELATPKLARVGDSVSWACRHILGVAYLGHILGISWPYLWHILAYLGHILSIYLSMSWTYIGNIFGISWTHLGHIFCISWGLGIS